MARVGVLRLGGSVLFRFAGGEPLATQYRSQ